jgi:hypothetical protein
MRAGLIATLALVVVLSLGIAADAGAASYAVTTCKSLTGPGAGPAPANVSQGNFVAETGCHLSGGQYGYRLQPLNQGAGERSVRSQWAGLQWTIPSGLSLTRAWAELGGTTTNGTGSGFGSPSKPWMFRTFGIRLGGAHLFAARFSVPNNSYWFNPSDSPGLYGWYWGNGSGGLGTPAQWNSGQPFSFGEANGLFSTTLLPGWATSQIGNTGVIPEMTSQIPHGPYLVYRAELRCAEEECSSAGFTQVRLQNVTFTVDDPLPPTGVTAVAEAGTPESNGARLLAGEWLGNGQLPVRWSGTDAGTGVSGVRLMTTPGSVGNLTELTCAGGRPGQVRNSFRPCGPGGSGTINFDIGQAPQGRSLVSACLEDGVSQRTCSAGFTLRRDSIAPVIDAPAMKLTQSDGSGFTLGVVNPDQAQIAAGARSPLSELTFTVEKKIGTDFQMVAPSRTADVSAQGSGEVISVSGIDLGGDGIYRVCVRLKDAAGNAQEGFSCTNLTVDDAVPDTMIVSGPKTLTGDPVARFGYTTDRPADSGFECRTDSGAWSSCPGPTVDDPFEVVLPEVDEDVEHRFEVRAWLPPGTSGTTRRVDPTPAVWRWTLDTGPPDTEIISGPPPVSGEDVTFTFRSTEPGSFECDIDSGDWALCTSPMSYVGLDPGDHLFRVRAKDEVGLIDPTPVDRQFTVVPTPPVVEVVEKPVPVPSRKYCALTGFSIRAVGHGIRASLTALRYSRFVRIQIFRDTPAVRRALRENRYRELKMYTPAGPILNLKRKAIRNARRSYVFPEINLRTYPALYDFHGERLIAVPRVSNEWNKCVLRYRQNLSRGMSGIQDWKRSWGIGDKFRLKRR